MHMHGAIKLMRAWTAALTLTVFLLSGTAFGLTANDEISSSLNGLPLLDPAGHLSVAYRILPDRFDSALNTSEPGRQEAPAAPGGDRTAVPSVGHYAKEFFPDLWGGTKRIFSPDIAPVALIGLGLTALAFTLDHAVEDYFQEQQPLSHVSHYGDSWGQVYVPFSLGIALFATGEIIDNKLLADTGAVSVEALAVTGIATETLKYITHRERPNHQDNMSFPSGHASMTSAFAASVSEMYDWNLFIAVPLFAAAAFVGASRFQDNMHFFSDVVAGVTLGTVVGISFARSFKEKSAGRSDSPDITLVPIVERGYRGIAFTWRF